MDVFEALETTRAIRRFSDTPVSDEEIMTCIRAATQAPSGGNIQPWQFLVVRDAETKRAIGDVYRRAYGRYEPALLRVRPPARSAEEEASFQRMVRASRHLAEHLADAPALVLVLMPNISPRSIASTRTRSGRSAAFPNATRSSHSCRWGGRAGRFVSAGAGRWSR